jgi:hypothetical protein
MTISETGGVNGTVMAAQIQEFIHQLSTELSKDERQVQRDARAAELREGLEAAQHMREKADAVQTGAIIGGVITMSSAAGQFCAASEFRTSTSDVPGANAGDEVKVAELRTINDKATAHMQEFGSTASLGSFVSQIYNASGDRAEARSQEAQTLSRAAGHQADEADSDLQGIEKIDNSSKELYEEISKNQHAGMMAILARQ